MVKIIYKFKSFFKKISVLIKKLFIISFLFMKKIIFKLHLYIRYYGFLKHLFLLICVILLILSIIYNNRHLEFIKFLEKNYPLIIPVFVAINIGIISILAISISMNKDIVHGITLSEYYKLRTNNYFDKYTMISLFIIISLFYPLFYSLNLYFTLVISFFISLILIIFVIIFELPMLYHSDKMFTHILKTAYVIAFIKDCKTDSMNILNKVSIEMINKDSSLLDLYKKVKR